MPTMESYLELTILLLGFAIIGIAASKIAIGFQRYRLPIITGFLFTGILSGPYLLNLVPVQSINRLNFINETALAFIAFAAGSELYFKELTSRLRSIKWYSIGQLSFTFILGSLTVFLLSSHIPYMRDMSLMSQIAASILTGTIFVARSPASAIAVIKELRAKGPFTQTVLGVTVIIDFAVIILFSVCFSFAKSIENGNDFDFLSILLPIVEIALSFGVGYVLGKSLEILLGLQWRRRIKAIWLMIMGYGTYWVNHYLQHISESLGQELRIEPLIVCIIASLYVTNYTKYKTEFLNILEKTGPVVYTAFFTLAGASLKLYSLFDIWYLAIFLLLVRLVAIMAGSYFGGFMANDPWRFIHKSWMPYITQAGVALGLSTLVSKEFTDWGADFATLIIAVIVINEIIGPLLFKYSLTKLGENRNRATFKTDGIRDAIIFGYENQSVSLAKQLMANGWKVQVVTRKKRGSIDIPEGLDVKHIPGVTLKVMKELGADKTEAIVCIMSDERNLETCELAYQNFGTPDLIVRLNDRSYYEKFLALGARIVDPSTAIVSLMDHFVRSPQATSLLLGMEKGQDTRDLELLDPNLHGITLRDLRLPSDVLILSVHRNGQMIISHGFTRLRLGDVVTFVGSTESLDEITVKFDHA